MCSMAELAVCLVSGGLDSCVSACCARAEGLELALLHIGYGQLTASRECRAFHDLADWLHAEHRLVVDVGHLSKIGGSALTDPALQLPEGEVDRQGVPLSYVPFRNANLLAVATSWAEVLGAHYIYVGAVEEDSSGYPDCRRSFFEAFNTAIQEGTRPETQITIVTPLIQLPKADIVRRGVEMEAPLGLTWSCYRNLDVPCDKCDSCLIRTRGFEEAGIEDPIYGGLA